MTKSPQTPLQPLTALPQPRIKTTLRASLLRPSQPALRNQGSHLSCDSQVHEHAPAPSTPHTSLFVSPQVATLTPLLHLEKFHSGLSSNLKVRLSGEDFPACPPNALHAPITALTVPLEFANHFISPPLLPCPTKLPMAPRALAPRGHHTPLGALKAVSLPGSPCTRDQRPWHTVDVQNTN